MKKRYYGLLSFLFLAFAGFLSTGSVFAKQTMGYVDLEFCNGSKHLIATMESGQTSYDICMNFHNYDPESVTFRVDIVDGQIAYGAKVSQACDTAPTGYFGKNTVLTSTNIISLGQGSTAQKHAIFTVPGSGFAGTVHGCITYQLVDKNKGGGMFSIISRKANLVDITVPGEVQSNFYLVPIQSIPGNQGIFFEQYGKQKAGDDNVKLLYQRTSHIITSLVGLKNDGYADEEYTVSARVNTIFGLVHHVFSGSAALLYAGQSVSNQLSIHIPWYEGEIHVAWKVDHRPKAFSGELERSWQTIEKTYSFFIMPRNLIILLCFVAVLIFITRHHLRKGRLRITQYITQLWQTIRTKLKKSS